MLGVGEVPFEFMSLTQAEAWRKVVCAGEDWGEMKLVLGKGDGSKPDEFNSKAHMVDGGN